MLSQDQCSLGKLNETTDGLYESWPERSNGLQLKKFQCGIDFSFDEFDYCAFHEDNSFCICCLTKMTTPKVASRLREFRKTGKGFRFL